MMAIEVQINRLPTGYFALTGRAEKGYASAARLRRQLFAWHSRSFYGTILDSAEIKADAGYTVEAILLSPGMALDYLAEPAVMLHADILWCKEYGVLNQAAKLLQESLCAGWYMPSYEAWRSGRTGWKLHLPAELLDKYEDLLQKASLLEISYLEEWFTGAVNEMILQEPDVASAWELVMQENALLQSGEGAILEDRAWMQEEEWLAAIGWKQDEAPLRTCLQLVEPDQIHGWSLRIMMQDKLDANLLVEVDERGKATLGTIPWHWQDHIGRKLSKDLAKCFRIVPELESQQEPGFLIQELSDEEAWRFMDEGSLKLVQAGISVLLPSWWEQLRLLKPQLKAKIHSSVGRTLGNSMFGMDQLMQFDWRIAVGPVQLTEAEFRQIAEEKKRLVRIRGNWIQLDPAFIERIIAAMKQVQSNKGLTLREILELHLLEEERLMAGEAQQEDAEADKEARESAIRIQVELNSHLNQLMNKLRQTKTIPAVEAPVGLQAQLRPYQREGVAWLLYLRQFGLGGCLADDMGLGKTIQFIAYLLQVRQGSQQVTVKERVAAGESVEPFSAAPNMAPALLICPTSVIGNWQKELEKFAPSLQVHLHYGSGRAKGERFADSLAGADLVVTSYSLSHLDEEELAGVEWDVVCLDEAQNIKNAYTKQASAIRVFPARQRIALTGTPIENRLTELWSIFDFINPGYLGSLKKFTDRYAKAIEKESDKERTAQMQALIRPFLLRRVKKDPAIQLDLPDKNEFKTYVPLTVEQGTLYENVVQTMLEKVDGITGMEKKGLILATLTKLKQICNHPALFLKEGGAEWAGRSTGAGGSAAYTAQESIIRSHKLTRLLEMIHELREEGERCLIFTQFVEMGHLLQSVIERERQEPVQFLHGGVPKAKRDQMIDTFQAEDGAEGERSCAIFILSLKAGGTGLNLTAANHVFHYDRWWNPAVENQATDRAFRIGQTRDVQVHKFITLGTLEEKIDEMIERKQGLSQQIVGSGESWVTEMSTSELRDLFALRKRWVEK